MKHPPRVWVAWIVCTLATATTVVQWVRSPESGALGLAVVASWVFDLVPLVSTVLAAIIVTHRPHHPIGWLLMVQGGGLTLASAGGAYLQSLPAAPANPGLPLLLLLWLDSWAWLLLIFPLFFIPLYFPTGHLLSPKWRAVVVLGLGMCVFLVALGTFGTELGNPENGWTLPNPLRMSAFAQIEQVEAFWLLWDTGLAVLALASVLAVFLRYRQGSQVERQQIKWLLTGCAVFVVVYVPTVLMASEPETAPSAGFALFWDVLFMLALLAIPAAIAVAILRYHLWDIDVIIRRTLIYSALTGVLALAYLGAVLVLEGVFRALTGQGQSSLVIVLSTLAIAALFGPVRARVQAGIDRRFYRRKYDAAQTLAAFAAGARDETDLEQLSERLVEVVDATLRPTTISLWLRQHEGR